MDNHDSYENNGHLSATGHHVRYASFGYLQPPHLTDAVEGCFLRDVATYVRLRHILVRKT